MSVQSTVQMVNDMELHGHWYDTGTTKYWYGARNPSSQGDLQKFLDWMRDQPYLLKSNANHPSNFRRIRKKNLDEVTLTAGDIIATPKHTMIFDQWINETETLGREGKEVCMN